MREIIFDTETTGLDPLKGDRLVEIGCIELFNDMPTGENFHVFLNPEREVNKDAERIHGLSTAFLKDKPKFAEIVDDFLAFLGDSPLVAHNAFFDFGFINAELSRAGKPLLEKARIIDTLQIARKKFPNQSNSLDALCQRFHIDLSNRTKHGALLDSELLAGVYLELKGGKQRGFSLESAIQSSKTEKHVSQAFQISSAPRLKVTLSDEELTLHKEMLTKIGEKALWNKI